MFLVSLKLIFSLAVYVSFVLLVGSWFSLNFFFDGASKNNIFLQKIIGKGLSILLLNPYSVLLFFLVSGQLSLKEFESIINSVGEFPGNVLNSDPSTLMQEDGSWEKYLDSKNLKGKDSPTSIQQKSIDNEVYQEYKNQKEPRADDPFFSFCFGFVFGMTIMAAVKYFSNK